MMLTSHVEMLTTQDSAYKPAHSAVTSVAIMLTLWRSQTRFTSGRMQAVTCFQVSTSAGNFLFGTLGTPSIPFRNLLPVSFYHGEDGQAEGCCGMNSLWSCPHSSSWLEPWMAVGLREQAAAVSLHRSESPASASLTLPAGSYDLNAAPLSHFRSSASLSGSHVILHVQMPW